MNYVASACAVFFLLFVQNWLAAENLDSRDDCNPTLCSALSLLFVQNWFAAETLNHKDDYDAINSDSSQTFLDCDHMVVRYTSTCTYVINASLVTTRLIPFHLNRRRAANSPDVCRFISAYCHHSCLFDSHLSRAVLNMGVQDRIKFVTYLRLIDGCPRHRKNLIVDII